ncbi:hypothetical protein JZ751_016231 [Albula glossodonta]|uniref:Uncharacterized protein n=1 Tax=Albula glossodonta TaxID=121402 RepID=A0A8T2MVP4_9TELE|nr:hypothetical protein JZ751_016231 [Albula glossodonta]
MRLFRARDPMRHMALTSRHTPLGTKSTHAAIFGTCAQKNPAPITALTVKLRCVHRAVSEHQAEGLRNSNELSSCTLTTPSADTELCSPEAVTLSGDTLPSVEKERLAGSRYLILPMAAAVAVVQFR